MLVKLITILMLHGYVRALGERIQLSEPWRSTDEFRQQSVNTTDLGNQSELETDQIWEYEPRIWLPELRGLEGVADGDDVDDGGVADGGDEHPELFCEDRESKGPGMNCDASNENLMAQESKAQSGTTNGASIKLVRERSYFWDSRRRHYGKLEIVSPTGGISTKQSGAEQKCNQFRVDIRETVICDKQRCDKLDFEWPHHDNQLVVIESTKHGMRFHRSEYAFQTSAANTMSPQRPAASAAHQKIAPPPIKFDIFELFKPKPTTKPWSLLEPSSTTAPSASSSTTSAAPTSATEETSSPTEAPATTSETPASEAATTAAAEETSEASNGATTSTPADGGPASNEPGASTTPDGLDEQQTTSSIRDQPELSSQDNNQTRFVTTFRVNTRRRRQTIIGFGGALSDATCRNIKSLSPVMAHSLMEDYFGSRGLRYNLARVSMGSSDFSTTPYTNNDHSTTRPIASGGGVEEQEDPFDDLARARHPAAPGSRASDELSETDDIEMKNFRLVDEDYEFKLPIIRQAIATSHQKIKFYSSLWSPPTWMKNNSHIVHGYLKGDIYGPYYKALAELILKWLEAYRKQGIEFWATTGLNEPITGVKPFIFHNSLGISRQDYITFIKLYLGPMLRQRGFADLKLIVLDDNKGYAPNFVKRILNDVQASKFVAGVGVHWYMNDEYENLDFIAREHSDKFILSTEACNGYLPFQVHTLPGDWDRGVAYMYDIIKLMHKNVAGWVDWNMALDLYGGPSWAKNNLDAPVIVNSERDEYYKSPMFYAIGHFSRFVEPNSTRVDHRLAYAKYDYPIEAAAYHTPRNYLVIVALNANHHRVPFKIIVDRQVIRVIDLRPDSFSTIVFKWNTKARQ